MKHISLILLFVSAFLSSAAFTDAWKIYPECGEVTSFVIDGQRDCIWFVQNTSQCTRAGQLGKLDIGTEKIEFKVSGNMDGGIGFNKVQMEGGHLWLAGSTNGPNRGGLAMYDIPSGSLLLYRVGNTAKDDLPGMRSDNVLRITAEKGKIWLYDSNPYKNWGLTCFNYMEQEQPKRWIQYTEKDEEKTPGGRLRRNGLTAVIPYNGQYILMSSEADAWQIMDPGTGTFRSGAILPGRPAKESGIAASVGKGKEWKISCGSSTSRLGFLGMAGSFLWFTSDVEASTPRTIPSAKMLICRDIFSNRCFATMPELSDSWEGAGDGLPDIPRCMGFDGEYIWLGGWKMLCRMNKRTLEFTRYNDRTKGNGFPGSLDIRQIAVTPDAVWFATDGGLLRYRKSDEFPGITGSSPASGEKEVKTGKTVSVSFDIPMNPNTIRKDTVQLYVNGGLYPADVSYDAETKTAVLSIVNALPSGMPCEIRLKSLVQAANGNPLASTKINFVTAQ